MPRIAKSTPARRSQKLAQPTPLDFLRRPVPIWEHLRVLANHGYAEDTILLCEITNQSLCTTRISVPDEPTQLATYRQIIDLYIKTKRYSPAGAMLKAIINTFPGQRPFSYPSLSIPVPPSERIEKTEEETEYQDSIWYSYYVTLHKTNRLRDALDALQHIRGPTYRRKRAHETPGLLREFKNSDESELVTPQRWKTELPDENSARTCSSSLGPIMSMIRKKIPESATLIKRFSDQFLGSDRSNIFWWLKSHEAAANYKYNLAIGCLHKMSHMHPRVLVQLARFNWEVERREETRRLLENAHRADPLWCDGMDLLCYANLHDFEKTQSLIEHIADMLTVEWPHRVETFVVNGMLAHELDHNDTAVSLSNRAMKSAVVGTEQYIFAVYLKVSVLRRRECLKDTDPNKWRTQIRSLLEEATKHMPHSPELASLYVDTYLEDEESHREAKLFAVKFLHNNPNNVHAKLLRVHAEINTVSRTPHTTHTTELFRILTEMLDEYPHVLPAYNVLLTEYARLKDHPKIREVLQRLTDARPLFSQGKTHSLHKMTADSLLRFDDVIPAYEHLLAAFATGTPFNQAMLSEFEAELAASPDLKGDYKNLAFLDPVKPEPSTSPATDRSTVSSALQEVVNDHGNEQSSDEDEEDEEDEEE